MGGCCGGGLLGGAAEALQLGVPPFALLHLRAPHGVEGQGVLQGVLGAGGGVRTRGVDNGPSPTEPRLARLRRRGVGGGRFGRFDGGQLRVFALL